MFGPVPTYWLGLWFVDLLIHLHNPCAFTCLDQQVGPVHVSFKKKTPWSKDKNMSWSHWSLHIHNKDNLPSIHPRGLFYANWISIYTPLQMPTRWKLRHSKEGLIHHSYTEWDGTLDPAWPCYTLIWQLHLENGWVFKILQLQGSPIKLVHNGLVMDETSGMIITILIIIGSTISTIDEKPPQTLEYSLFGILILSHGMP